MEEHMSIYDKHIKRIITSWNKIILEDNGSVVNSRIEQVIHTLERERYQKLRIKNGKLGVD